jgi:hypothetical protein
MQLALFDLLIPHVFKGEFVLQSVGSFMPVIRTDFLKFSAFFQEDMSMSTAFFQGQ